MTPKQARFVDEYMVDLNATQAAIRAGYSEKTSGQIGHALLKKVDIQELVTAARFALADRTEITIDEIMRRFDEVAQRCMQAEPVLDRKGNPVYVDTADGDLVPAYTFNAAGANRALELLGKHLGAFVERHEITGKDGGPIETWNAKADYDFDNPEHRRTVKAWYRLEQQWEDEHE